MTEPNPATLHWTTALVEAEIERTRIEAWHACARIVRAFNNGRFDGGNLLLKEVEDAIRAGDLPGDIE